MRRRSTKYVCEMPNGWDERGEIREINGRIIAVHPDSPAMVLRDGAWIEIGIKNN